ncbi:MAG: cytochrome c-type biosis protein CcmF [Actinomycetota bacterium]|nr:cytochrome c-type biosis protein CcmF [Actinomycetota bacterium]
MGLTALGVGALVLALVAACAIAVASWTGAVDWGRRGLAVVFGLVTVGVAALAWALVGQDYSLVYVADHASRDTTWPYRLAGLWGGMAGSLLLWTWMLAGWALLASRSVRRRVPDLAGGTQAVLAVEAAVFLGLLVTVSRPFATLAVPAVDGGGLTPILRHPAMLYHPPLLYSGYVGLAVPAAMAVAALVTRSAGDWLTVARRYMVASLVLLAVGMTAGAHWAYVELGWGGYWAWDPVENGALLPWLAGIAFLHSALLARHRRADADDGLWRESVASRPLRAKERAEAVVAGTHGLAFLAFGLSLLGAFLTRSGTTASVHAFAEARAVGRVLLAALAMTAVALVALSVRRRGPRPAPVPTATLAGAVRVNNALLLAVIVVVGFGLLYPVLSGDDLVVTGRYFAIVTAPLALGVLAAIGVGPRLGWQPRPWAEVRTRLRPAGWGAAAALVAAVLTLDNRRPLSLAMIALAGGAAALTVAQGRSRIPVFGANGSPPDPTATKTGRSGAAGAFVAHLGVAVLLAGVAGTATGTHRTASLVPGQSITVRGFTLRLDDVAPVDAPDGGRAARADIDVSRDQHHVATLRPVALIAASGDRVSEAALRSTPFQDLQIALRSVSGGGGAVVVEVFVVPMAQWVWWGALLVALGIAVAARHQTDSAATAVEQKVRSDRIS